MYEGYYGYHEIWDDDEFWVLLTNDDSKKPLSFDEAIRFDGIIVIEYPYATEAFISRSDPPPNEHYWVKLPASDLAQLKALAFPFGGVSHV